MAGRLAGRTAIVTGGNSGIGAAIVRLFGSEGAHVAILARREVEGLAVQEEVREAGGDATFIACDVTERVSVEAAAARVLRVCGNPSVLVNNAGSVVPALWPHRQDEAWEETIRVNLTGPYLVSQLCWAHMVAGGGGSIVNISSFSAVAGVTPGMRHRAAAIPPPAFGAAKAGVEAFTRFLASYGAEEGIRVNAVRGGLILTPLHLRDSEGRSVLEELTEMQMIEGFGTPEDMAKAVLFLASDDARFITGQVLNVDGGIVGKV